MANKIDIERNLYIEDAHLYDLDNRDLLKKDIPFYLDYAKKVKGPILELACGTGRVTIPLAEAGHEIWGLELSDSMLEVLNKKIKDLPTPAKGKIHLVKGDMSNFKIDRKFPLIIIPYRSFQILYDEKLENSCLHNVFNHLSDDGYFIINIGNFERIKENTWEKEEEVLDWENIDLKTGNTVSRHHIIRGIDEEKNIVFITKVYRIKKRDVLVEKIEKQIQWKYFYEDKIKRLLESNGLKIIKEMGSYDGKPIQEGTEFIFICRKI